ncbi:hypothetical protein HMPREF1008_01835 [Olsenella sp. oral taxon 809 str. F0356]|uniref:HelD family protein n=1 Tax=Olsenella sp. oral taxon 809 TaxID=661086 RepID=UPI000231F25F|nr:ATP-binding domain-containing protein [Olsenella sp. oral taxon 809]EHF01355.1 hypothetical protein HMPREF1008_01835 [Olsenella sp. oral taxon 809 str. F0356]
MPEPMTSAADTTATHQDDPVFLEEQDHLKRTHERLRDIHDAVQRELETTHEYAAQDLRDMSEEVRLNFNSDDETMETLAAIETLNSVIDTYNQHHDFTLDRLRRTLLLLRQPYFAKVRLQMRPGRPARNVYIGTVGITDERQVPLIVDWRSPVAQTYYNQEVGPTSYEVDGRTKTVNLELRRQFDVVQDRLRSYFDASVAIQDALLLGALRRHHSEKLQAITATIQREQNQVVRHEDVPALLVDGIAGSGKTSVLLQRIAYLFYQERESLRPDQVYLFSPNDIFARYIDTVLPSLGESNPHTLTWKSFLAEQGLDQRSGGEGVDASALRELGRSVASIVLEDDDFRDIRVGDMRLVSAAQIRKSVEKHVGRLGMGPRLFALVKEDLHQKVERRMSQLAHNEELQEQMLSLDVDEQMCIFGELVAPADEDETVACARRYARELFSPAFSDVDSCSWLRLDRIGMRVTGRQALSAIEWLYLKLALTGDGTQDARYVMVDEVQDYSEAQLMLLARYFGRAHFLLLGDRHQAIREGSASFEAIRSIFKETHGTVAQCRLLTSYRSSPEITELFCGLLDEEERVTLSSVRRPGVAPLIRSCPQDADAYLAELRAQVEEARGREGLCAVVAQDKARANWLSRQLGDSVTYLGKGDELPKEGVVLLDLRLAKGLEFDEVIVPDAQAEAYPGDEISRRRLYTAISRAMHRVVVLSQGPMTPLLDA